MSDFKRLDFINNCAKRINEIMEINDNRSSFIFNFNEDEKINGNTFNALVFYLKEELNIPKEDCEAIELKDLNFKELSLLPKVTLINLSPMSSVNIGVISSQYRLLRDSNKTYVFNCSKSQHLDLVSGFEPFQFRDRVFFDLEEDLIKYQSYKSLDQNIKDNDKKKGKLIKV